MSRNRSKPKGKASGRPAQAAARALEADDNTHPRRKLSIAVPNELIGWVTEQSEVRGVSVSSIFVEAVQHERRRTALEAYLKELGTDDITDEDMETFYAELRERGVKV